MIGRFRFPIRLKILVTFLGVITVVVSLIIITMANLFNNDKTTYIRDLASVIALHVAEEANSLLQGYHQRLRVFTEIVHNKRLSSDRKRDIVAGLFRNFDDFVAVSVQAGDAEPVMVYDGKALEAAGLEKKDLVRKHTGCVHAQAKRKAWRHTDRCRSG